MQDQHRTSIIDLDDLKPFERRNAKVTGRKGHNRGFWVTFDNGWKLSIQTGAGNYCANYDMRDFTAQSPPSPDAEIAATFNGGELLPWDSGDTVAGWVKAPYVHWLLDQMEADLLDASKPLPAAFTDTDQPSSALGEDDAQ